MLSVVAVALWLNRIASVSDVLCTALGVVVFLDPWAVLWRGFWLSFSAGCDPVLHRRANDAAAARVCLALPTRCGRSVLDAGRLCASAHTPSTPSQSGWCR